MNKLMSHTDYEDSIDLPNISDIEFRIKSRKYRQFIKQPLEKWMFVPCDEDGNVLEEPFKLHYGETVNESYPIEMQKYQQAKERCLFEGFEMYCSNAVTNNEISVIFTKSGGILLYRNYKKYVENIGTINVIEDLVKYNLQLTQTAIKQLGL